MKKKTLGTVITIGIVATAIAVAQLDNLQIDENAPQPAPEQQKLIRVCTLNNIQANQEFQRNVRILQAQRQRAVELNNAIEGATSSTEKAELQQELDELIAKLNENNQKMVQTYGFSLTRNYTMVVETAHIYMFVSDEEAARYEEAQQESQE